MPDSAVVKDKARSLVSEVKNGALVVGGATAALWAIEVVDLVVFGGGLDGFGIVPRTSSGLSGILFAPLLHGGFAHLALNTVSLLVLAPLTMMRKRMDLYVVTAIGGLVSGLGTWAIGGANTVHIGASGVIFAMLGFLMARGWFERSVGSVVLSVVVTWLFGSALWGMIPFIAGGGISWEAHLFGFIGGLITARLLGRQLRKKSP